MHHEQDIFRISSTGGLHRQLPKTFWPFLAGALCLSGVPPTGGFFSKDSILTAAWTLGGTFYTTLYLIGLFTVFLTAIYTFRMMFLVFGDRAAVIRRGEKKPPAQVGRLPRIMEKTLIPLVVLSLAGGVLNIPAYLGGGLLDAFLAPPGGAGGAHSPVIELLLQGVAFVVALFGIAVAWRLYGREHRAAYIASAELPPTALTVFLRKGWYVDALYVFLFVRPYKWLSAFLWQRVDEGVIDDSLDRMAIGFGRTGQILGRWGGGRVSLYLLSLAAGATLMVAWFAWLNWGAV